MTRTPNMEQIPACDPAHDVDDWPEDYDPPKDEDPTTDPAFIQWMNEQDEQQRIEDEWFISNHPPDQCKERHPGLWPAEMGLVEHFPFCGACRFKEHMDGLCLQGTIKRCHALDRQVQVCHFEHAEPPMLLSEIHARAAAWFRLMHLSRMMSEFSTMIKGQEEMMERLMSLAADMED